MEVLFLAHRFSRFDEANFFEDTIKSLSIIMKEIKS